MQLLAGMGLSAALSSMAGGPLAKPEIGALQEDARGNWKVDPASGVLEWRLDLGAVRGFLDVPVVLRHCTAPFCAQGPDLPEVLKCLHFGYLLPVRGASGSGPGDPLRFCLEDGATGSLEELATPLSGDGVLAGFGFALDVGGGLCDEMRRWARFSGTTRNLGRWAGMHPGNGERTLQFLVDGRMARVFAYHAEAESWLPELWVDRQGHGVTFEWVSAASEDGRELRLRIRNGEGTGLDASYRLAGVPGPECTFLSVDFTGQPSPSARVLGAMVGGTPEGGTWASPPRFRPSKVWAGSPPRPLGGHGPKAPGKLVPPRIWRFEYESIPGPSLPVRILDPHGLETRFTYAIHEFSGLRLHGISRAVSWDLNTGETLSRTWDRSIPAEKNGTWTVSCRHQYAEGKATEDRETRFRFRLVSPDPRRAVLESQEVIGASGVRHATCWKAGLRLGSGGPYLGECTITASGAPEMTWLTRPGAHSGVVGEEDVSSGGRPVLRRRFAYDAADYPLAPSSMEVYSRREVGPDMRERWKVNPEGRLESQEVDSSGRSVMHEYAYGAQGYQVQSTTRSSWSPAPGPAWTWEIGPQGLTGKELVTGDPAERFQERWSRDEAGRVVRHVDAKGRWTIIRRDIWGRPLTVERQGEQTLQIDYPDERNTTWRQGSLRGSIRRDAFGRIVQVLRPDGITENCVYDRIGRLVATHEASGKASRIAWEAGYDALDRPVAQSTPPLPKVEFTYEATATGTRVRSSVQGRKGTEILLDPWGREVERRDPDIATWTHRNAFGQVTRIVQEDREGHRQERTWVYDALGNLLEKQGPEFDKLLFGDLDALGRPGKVTRSDGQTSRWSWDSAGRLTYIGAKDTWIRQAYEGLVLASKRCAEGISQTFRYAEGSGLLEEETLSLDGRTYKVGYRYGPHGKLSGLSYPSGREVEILRDARLRPTQVRVDGRLLAALEYDPWGNRTSLRFASGAESRWTWDAGGWRPTAWTLIHAEGTEVRPFEYDQAGRITRAGEWAAAYDEAGRIASSSGFGFSAKHRYDGFGNAVEHDLEGDRPDAFIAFASDPQPENRLPGILANGGLSGWIVSSPGEALQMGGRVGGKEGLEFGWSGLGRLLMARNLQTGEYETYRYAPSGMRVAVVGKPGKEGGRREIRTDRGWLLSEEDEAGRWKRDIINLDGEVIAEIDGEGIHELHGDQVGTPRAITSGASGKIHGRQAFSPFGEQLGEEPHRYGYRPATGFTGHAQTDATGLIYMRARYYSPAWHRFLSPDFGADKASLNQFAYVDGDPLGATDPSGLMKRVWPTWVPAHLPDGTTQSMIDGGGATVPVDDQAPRSLPQINVPHGFRNTPVLPMPSPAPNFGPYIGPPPPMTSSISGSTSSSDLGNPTQWRDGRFQLPTRTADPVTRSTMSTSSVSSTSSAEGRGDSLIASGNLKNAFTVLKEEKARIYRSPLSSQSTVSTPVSTTTSSTIGLADTKAFLGNLVGIGQCVSYVKAVTPGLAGIQTSRWKAGLQVKGANLQPGTAIMTSQPGGGYPTGRSPKHAAIYLGQDEHGIRVLDQWAVKKDKNGKILREAQVVHERVIRFTGRGGVNDGDAYFVVKLG